MSELSIDDKIKLLSITRGLMTDGGGAVLGGPPKLSDVKEMYCLVRDLVLVKEDETIQAGFCYAVAKHEDGTVDLTVFEGNTGATIELDRSSLKRLIEELNIP